MQGKVIVRRGRWHAMLVTHESMYSNTEELLA